MSYIDANLLSDETILFRTKKHVIIFIYPLLWTIVCVIAAITMPPNPFIAKVNWIPWVVTLFFWAIVWLEYVTSEFAVTNKRVMMREGFFYRHTNEMRLSTISQVNVDQSLVGQCLNYGRVSINAFGASDAFSTIAQPFLFQKYVNEQLNAIVK